jgi:hypothetical protein
MPKYQVPQELDHLNNLDFLQNRYFLVFQHLHLGLNSHN